MAYLTPDTNRRRIVALGAVGAVHGVMAIAILSGFAGGIIQINVKHWTPSWTYPPPPKAPSPAPAPTPALHPRDATPKPDVILPTDPMVDTGLRIDAGTLPPIDTGIGTGALPPLPAASPSPTFTPRAARPIGVPGRWVSDADYPASALRRGEQGVTGFEITVGPDGRVRECRVVRSSGSADLDAATCARVTERARFTPARDEHGDMVASRYANAIRWQIPE